MSGARDEIKKRRVREREGAKPFIRPLLFSFSFLFPLILENLLLRARTRAQLLVVPTYVLVIYREGTRIERCFGERERGKSRSLLRMKGDVEVRETFLSPSPSLGRRVITRYRERRRDFRSDNLTQ